MTNTAKPRPRWPWVGMMVSGVVMVALVPLAWLTQDPGAFSRGLASWIGFACCGVVLAAAGSRGLWLVTRDAQKPHASRDD